MQSHFTNTCILFGLMLDQYELTHVASKFTSKFNFPKDIERRYIVLPTPTSKAIRERTVGE